MVDVIHRAQFPRLDKIPHKGKLGLQPGMPGGAFQDHHLRGCPGCRPGSHPRPDFQRRMKGRKHASAEEPQRAKKSASEFPAASLNHPPKYTSGPATARS